MTTNPNPSQSVLHRVTFLRNVAQNSYQSASDALEMALRDAVQWRNAGNQSGCPSILTQEGLVKLFNLKKNLTQLIELYTEQLNLLQTTIAEANKPPATSPEEQQRQTMEQLLSETEQAATQASLKTPSDMKAFEEVVRRANEVTVQFADGTPTVSAARAAAAQSRAAALASLDPAYESPAAAPSTGGLPRPTPLTDVRAASAIDEAAAPPSNSLAALFGPDSPLLDIFAPSPWLPNGRGAITVGSTDGSNDYKWYKSIDPLLRDSNSRAVLPSGFYGGPERPKCAVLRLDTIMLVWSFELAPECMSVYVVGLSDAQERGVRWFSPTELSATFTRRLLTELVKYASVIKQAGLQ